MLPAERYEQILKHLTVHSHVKISELCEMLEATEPTLRTDLAFLESQGKLVKIRGGAAAVSARTGGLSLEEDTMGRERSLVARCAAEAVPDGALVFMAACPTVLRVAQELALAPFKKVTVVTNFLDIAQALLHNPRMRVILCGGPLHTERRCTFGEEALRAAASYHTDIAMVGCQGLSKERGIFDEDEDSATLKRVVMEHSRKVWLCADHSKFNRSGLVKFSELSEVDTLFTNKLPSNWPAKELPLKVIAAEV